MLANTPVLSNEELLALGQEIYGVEARWMQALIGTTVREGYSSDPYLAYAWACELLNNDRKYTADGLYTIMNGWGSVSCEACGHYYGEHAVVYGCSNHGSYSTSPDWVRQCILLALINKDYRICEVDGMISPGNPPSGYSLIYNSSAYNCQVWGH